MEIKFSEELIYYDNITTFICGLYSLPLHQILIYGYERLKSTKGSIG